MELDDYIAKASASDGDYFEDIAELDDIEIIEIAKALKRNQLRKWYNFHRNTGYSYPLNAYVFIKSKLDGYVWFSAEDYAARVAAGKRVRYVTEEQLVIEAFEDTFYNHELGFKKKMAIIYDIPITKSKKIRLNIFLSFFDLAYEKVKQRNLGDEVMKSLRKIKSAQTRLNTAMELREEDIDFKTLDGYLRIF